MNLFKVEFNKTAYLIDLLTYLVAPFIVLALIAHFGHRGDWPVAAMALVTGFIVWTLLEYIIHRFILHRFMPFRKWHDQHHSEPRAEIGTPTVISLLVLSVGVFLPAILLAGVKPGGGFALGILAGYGIYAWMHHGEHHWRAGNRWFRQLKRGHAIHHHTRSDRNFGVTTSFWDRIFGTHLK